MKQASGQLLLTTHIQEKSHIPDFYSCLDNGIWLYSCKDQNYIYFYAPIYHSGAFYIFGGYPSDTQNIGRLDAVTFQWSLAGKLQNGRYAHGVIYEGSSFLIVGGDGSFKTEECVLDGTVMTCTEQQSSPLSYYRYYPALFLTVDNYGDDCWNYSTL